MVLGPNAKSVVGGLSFWQPRVFVIVLPHTQASVKDSGRAKLAGELARTLRWPSLGEVSAQRPACLDSPETALKSYLMCIPEIAREITSCWISAVPSKMS
jgi:hypothetical protein